MLLLYHLKQLTLSFQKNIKSLKSDTPNKSYSRSKISNSAGNMWDILIIILLGVWPEDSECSGPESEGIQGEDMGGAR